MAGDQSRQNQKNSGKPSITWPESVDEALCLGWINGVRQRLDDESYVIRFSSRKATSIWSAVNIRNVERLIKEDRMRPAGMRAYEAGRSFRHLFIRAAQHRTY
jgi:uncharacterized protein YdeI (YjbR/CyaY-like superfamily)